MLFRRRNKEYEKRLKQFPNVELEEQEKGIFNSSKNENRVGTSKGKEKSKRSL
jgi:hypothetical protein